MSLTEDKIKEWVELEEKRKEIYSRPDAHLVAGVKRWYSAREAARFFGRSSTWIYNRIAEKKFTDEHGAPLQFKQVGDGPRPRMRFNLEILKEMALSGHRDGLWGIDELKAIFKRMAMSEYEEKLPEPDYE